MLNLVLTHFGVAYWYHVFQSAIWGDISKSLKMFYSEGTAPTNDKLSHSDQHSHLLWNLMASTENSTTEKLRIRFIWQTKTEDVSPGHSFSGLRDSLGEVREEPGYIGCFAMKDQVVWT